MPKLLIIAIGGNSLIKDPRYQRVEDQYAAICETARPIVDIIEDGYRTVISHPRKGGHTYLPRRILKGSCRR